MANCVLCGQAGSEQTGHRGDATAGALHRDCAYLSYLLSMADRDPMPDQRKMVQRSIDKLVHKKQGTTDSFP